MSEANISLTQTDLLKTSFEYVAPMGLGAIAFLTDYKHIAPTGLCDSFLPFPVVTCLETKFSFYPADYAKGRNYSLLFIFDKRR